MHNGRKISSIHKRFNGVRLVGGLITKMLDGRNHMT